MAGPPRGPVAPGRFSVRRRWTLALLTALLAVGVLFSPLLGTVAIAPETVLRILLHQLSSGRLFSDPCAGAPVPPSGCPGLIEIVWDARLSEVVLAVTVGAGLGLSGGTLQGVFRNPLADPFLLGLSSGGTLGTAVVVVFRVGVGEQNLLLPLFAFVGAIATGLVILVAARSRFGSVETLLLTGVALSSFLSAVLALLLVFSPTGSLQVDFWLLGNLGALDWSEDGIVFGVVLVAGTLLVAYGRELSLLQLGSDVAQSLGVDARKVRVRLLLLTSVTTAAAVAFTGVIGFVGLVSPHVVRRIAGNDYRVVLPGAALVGAGFLLAARDLALVAFPGTLLPIGIFTSFVGAPFFAYLLFRRRRASTMGAP
ncbi:MAG TPA: iron ABC transporter permease [Thermoplasmata archaeon]|jgi:iron complex transport system permease protein|nr:iron ABC transporter permease [Thermoplasmata archaeon]